MLGNYLWRPRRMSALVLVAMSVLALAGCSEDEAADVTATAEGTPSATAATATATATVTTIEVTDSSGETIVLEAPAVRIVSHSPAATEILFAIGAGDAVVAADEFSNYPPEAESLPKVTYSTPDPEQDLGFDPDLVIFAGRQESSLAHFRELELRVFYLEEPSNLEGVFENIRTLGVLTGREAEAESVVAEMQATLDEVAAAIADVEEGPVVFYELTEDLYTVSPNSFIGAALSFVKARNVAEGVDGDFPQLTSEAIVEANPDVILMADADFVDPASVPERAGWSAITAVTEGQIHPVDGDIMSRPGPRIVDGIADLARLLYPDRFE
ncbi:MAG: ABC transporter substrate-binding protein [Dehalococcoidia bacterium]